MIKFNQCRGRNGVPPPKVVVPPPGNYVSSPLSGKIIKTVAIRRQILTLKYTKFFISAGASSQTPLGGAYSAPPYLLAVFKGPTSKGQEEWKGRGGNTEYHQLFSVI